MHPEKKGTEPMRTEWSARSLSPAASFLFKEALLKGGIKELPLNPGKPLTGHNIISFGKKVKMPSHEFFRDARSVTFISRFPFSEQAMEAIVLASVVIPGKVILGIKDTDREGLNLALFTANQLELPVIFLPPGSGKYRKEYIDALREVAKIWVRDKRIRIDLYPVKTCFVKYISSLVRRNGTVQTADLYQVISEYLLGRVKGEESIEKALIEAIRKIFPVKEAKNGIETSRSSQFSMEHRGLPGSISEIENQELPKEETGA